MGQVSKQVFFANARDLSGSGERMPKSTMSFPNCCCVMSHQNCSWAYQPVPDCCWLFVAFVARWRCLLVNPVSMVSNLLALP